MPKILNLTIEEKAERYSKLRKGAVHLTIEERAVKWDEHVIYNSKKSMEYASRHKDKIALSASQHYIKNKEQYNLNQINRRLTSRVQDNLNQKNRRQKQRELVPVPVSTEL